jgi:hypothetical protein
VMACRPVVCADIASFEKRLGEVRKKQTVSDDNVNDSLTVTNE